MLHMRHTRLTDTRHADILPGVQILEEGIALEYVKLDGETYVQPSTGTTGRLFAGVSLERYAPARSLSYIQEYELTEEGTVQLPRTPAAGQISIIEGTNVIVPTVGEEAPDSGTGAVLKRDVLMFAPGDSAKGRVVRVQMGYVPDLDEARTLQGDAPFGGHASAMVGIIGRILNGEISTSAFDVSKDWTNVLQVALGADGKFTPAGNNNAIPQVVVKNTPNAANPFLSLALNVA